MKLEKEQLRPRGPFERSAVLGCFPLLCCFAASVLEGPKYLVTDIPIDVLSRSPRVRIGPTAVSDIRSGVDTGAERSGSSAPHKVRLQQIHTLLGPIDMQGPSGLRSFV